MFLNEAIVKFSYDQIVRDEFPELVSRALTIEGVSPRANSSVWVAHFSDIAWHRLRAETESTFPEIQAWRKAYTRMGLKPTQYRCASEALLRRFRNDRALPNIHPLIDLCNAVSIAFAIPIAVFDLNKITGDLQVRLANGDEIYETFGGVIEQPEPGEVIFADSVGRAHARRWVNRQSGYSAVREETVRALIVAEALHKTAGEDVARLLGALRRTVAETWISAVITQGHI